MHKTLLVKLIVIGFVIWGMTGYKYSMAQEVEYILAQQDIFGKLRRPHVNFPHEIHSDMLAEKGCGVCHHVQDDQTGQLIYEEGEEQSCQECHLQQKESHKPALREAYHGSCTVCHRQLKKRSNLKSGPTTCGGCHIKY